MSPRADDDTDVAVGVQGQRSDHRQFCEEAT